MSPKNAGGVSENGTWTPAFPGQRPPFQVGHLVSVKHGAYSVRVLAPRKEEIAETLRSLIDAYDLSYEPMVQLTALALARVERAVEALEQNPDLANLSRDALGWANAAKRNLEALGLSPMARTRLRLSEALISRTADLDAKPLAIFGGDAGGEA